MVSKERTEEIKNCVKEDGEFSAEAAIECAHCYKRVSYEQDFYEFGNSQEELFVGLVNDLIKYGWEVKDSVCGRVKYLVCSDCKGNQDGN